MSVVDDFRFFIAYAVHMGGPRASTTRQVHCGKMCVSCHGPINPPTGQVTECARCIGKSPIQSVFMRFERIFDVWRVSLVAGDPPLKEFTFADSSKVEEMARRGNGLSTLADKQAPAMGIRQGRGGLELKLTRDQLAALRR